MPGWKPVRGGCPSLKYSNRGICRGKALLGTCVDPEWSSNLCKCLPSSNYWQRVRRARRRTRLSGFSRIKTGIAGLAVGVFSASVVWAFKLPQDNQPQPKIQEIVSESFENPEQNFKRRFPFEAGKWFGNIYSISAGQKISSVSGLRVAQFLDNPKAKFAYARYLIDLKSYAEVYPTHSRSLRVDTSFFASNMDDSSVFPDSSGSF